MIRGILLQQSIIIWLTCDLLLQAESGPCSLEQQLRTDYNHTGRGDMSAKDLDQLASMLRRLIVLDPTKRASAEEIANDPWLTETNGPL